MTLFYTTMELSKRISLYRKQLGMTQKNLADAIGAKQSHISRLERGDYQPSHEGVRTSFRRISDATGIHLHPHKLRHSFAVAWILNGGDSFTLQAILGHESQEMTSQYVKIAGMDASSQHSRHSPGDRV